MIYHLWKPKFDIEIRWMEYPVRVNIIVLKLLEAFSLSDIRMEYSIWN